MMTILEKVSYLKGMAEGMKLDKDSDQGKLLSGIIDLLEDVGLSVADLDDEFAELGAQVDEIDEDLATLEDDYYSLFDDDDDYWDEDEDDESYEVECPECGKIITLNEDAIDEGEIICPQCGEKLEFDIDDAECDCGCCSDEKEDKD